MSDSQVLLIVLGIVFLQATFIFYDASKRGERKWLWGLFGLIQVPSSLIIYLIITRIVLNTKTCPHCLYAVKGDSKYCSYCGKTFEEESKDTE